MEKKKVGKPKTYPEEKLNLLLMKYVEDHPQGEITYLGLEKATGISRNTWSRNMKEKIDLLNNPLPILDSNIGDKLPLPNISDIVERYYPNKDKIIEAMQHLGRSLHKLYDKAKTAHQLEQENKSLHEEVSRHQQEAKRFIETIDQLNLQVEFYSAQYRNIALSSTYSENSIHNFLEFKKEDRKNEDKITADLEKHFNLFNPSK